MKFSLLRFQSSDRPRTDSVKVERNAQRRMRRDVLLFQLIGRRPDARPLLQSIPVPDQSRSTINLPSFVFARTMEERSFCFSTRSARVAWTAAADSDSKLMPTYFLFSMFVYVGAATFSFRVLIPRVFTVHRHISVYIYSVSLLTAYAYLPFIFIIYTIQHTH